MNLATTPEGIRCCQQSGRRQVVLGPHSIQVRTRIVRVEAELRILDQPLPVLGLDVVRGSSHEENGGQDLDEDEFHPGRHPMCLR